MSPYERVQLALNDLKSQQSMLAKLFPVTDTATSTVHGSPLPSTAEEHHTRSPPPITSYWKNRSSTAASLSDGGSIWYDAIDGEEGAEEFVLDNNHLVESSLGTDSKVTVADGHSSLYNDSDASDTDEEHGLGGPTRSKELNSVVPTYRGISRRTQLPCGPVGDEGSLFAVMKKNIGKVSYKAVVEMWAGDRVCQG